MKHGADVNYVNSLGNSVLMVALSANHGTPIIAILRCLVAAGADLSKTGGRLISVIWQAARIVGNKNLEYEPYRVISFTNNDHNRIDLGTIGHPLSYFGHVK